VIASAAGQEKSHAGLNGLEPKRVFPQVVQRWEGGK
jgi:hypothetical protein